MKNKDDVIEPILPPASPAEPESEARPTRSLLHQWIYPLMVVAAFMVGLLVSSLVWGTRSASQVAAAPIVIAPTDAPAASKSTVDLTALLERVNPSAGYTLPVSYGALGPALLKSGAIDYEKFIGIYAQGGDPLTQEQIDILKQGSDKPIVITTENAHFLLNFFWAVGLVNENTILTEGPIMQYSKGKIESFASTGGWTVGAKPVTELFASAKLIELTTEQQARVQEAAAAVYRPCCDNPTLFPDCNHGMAMLGILELMGSQDATVDEMLTMAKYVSAYWFPQQAVETAIYLKAAQNVDFEDADPRLFTGVELFSGSGSGRVHAALQKIGLLPESPDGGGSCGT